MCDADFQSPFAASIDEVIEQLDEIINWARDNNSRLGYFAALYRTVTIRVRDGIAAGDAAIEQTNDILLELNKILEAMIDIASFNELIDLLRTLIDDQKTLLDKTEAQRKKNFFDD